MTRRSQYARAAAFAVAFGLAACAPHTEISATAGRLRVVAVERVYGDLARQLGGDAISVTTILDSPSADPHAYEPTTSDAAAIAAADVVVENGLGYDAFADKLAAASPRAARRVLVVGTLGGHRTGDNPHVWYEPRTLRAYVSALAPLVRANGTRERALLAWTDAFAARVKALGTRHRGASVAITEPVFDYVLRGAGLRIATPPAFSHAIEEGNDPPPQDVDTMNRLLAARAVAAFVYNEQTQEPSTEHLLAVAHSAGVGVVPVTETLPAARTTQQWIDGELDALDRTL